MTSTNGVFFPSARSNVYTYELDVLSMSPSVRRGSWQMSVAQFNVAIVPWEFVPFKVFSDAIPRCVHVSFRDAH